MENTEKLLEILEKNDVAISNKGYICLYDFVDNIVESKNIDLYIKKLPKDMKKKCIDDEDYISPKDCIRMLKNTNKIKCKSIYEKITFVDENGESIIDVKEKIFQFGGHRFLAFFVGNEEDWNVWVKGSEVAKYLGYADDKQAIRDHVDNDNKMNFQNFLEFFPMVEKTIPKNIDKKTIFINLSGFFNLIHESKKPLAKKIRKWIDDDVLPSLVKYGVYVMQPKNLDLKFFYDENTISDFDGKAVLYIAHVGRYDGIYYFKYGLSRSIYQREYKQHRKQFETFKLLFIGECDNCEKVEELFEHELKVRKLHFGLTIKEKPQTELFASTTKFPLDFFIGVMKKLIDGHKLPVIKEADAKIGALSVTVDAYRQTEELRKLELQYRLSDNYKLELENEKIRLENEVAVKSVDLDIEREKSIRAALQKGFDVTHLLHGNKNNVNVPKKNKKDKKDNKIIGWNEL